MVSGVGILKTSYKLLSHFLGRGAISLKLLEHFKLLLLQSEE